MYELEKFKEDYNYGKEEINYMISILEEYNIGLLIELHAILYESKKS